MDEQQITLYDNQGPPGEPVQQLVAIRRLENRRDRVLLMRPRMSRGHGQQMQVVVAEHRDRRGAETLDLAQHRERIRTAVDEIADEP